MITLSVTPEQYAEIAERSLCGCEMAFVAWLSERYPDVKSRLPGEAIRVVVPEWDSVAGRRMAVLPNVPPFRTEAIS